MSVLSQFEDSLRAEGAFDKNKNKVAEAMISVLGDDVPYTMGLAIANFTMASFVGHFHYKIHIEDDNQVPANMIVFILAKSGAKKTSSVTKLEKIIQPGLDVIQMIRKNKAEILAKENDVPVPKLMPLSNALSTVPGLLANLNSFKAEGIGLPSMIVDEVSTAIDSNLDFIPNVEVVSQLFDAGDCKVKVLKDKEQQSDEVKGMGMNALFIGSEKGILEEKQILKKFETEFISKLARRCYFVYPVFRQEAETIEDVKSYMAKLKEKKLSLKDKEEYIKELSCKIAGNLVAKDSDLNIIVPTEDCMDLKDQYEIWCAEKAKLIPDEEEHRILEQQHRHWKAFKLAGAYAVWDMSHTIEKEHMLQAIYSAELTSNDLTKFINMARREPYEIVLDMFGKEPQRVFTLHELIKLRILKSDNQIEALIRGANSKLGTTSHVEYIMGRLSYHEHCRVTVDYEHWASYKGVSSVAELTAINIENGLEPDLAKRVAKETIAKEAATGYKCKQAVWSDLAKLLCNNCAYIPFRFKTEEEGASVSEYTKGTEGGIRRKDNIISPATWVVFDIDKTDVSIDEMRDNLSDYTYHMSRGSDPHNPYKYRIIMPLDIEIELDSTRWKHFMKALAGVIGADIDDLPQSQFFYGYSGNEVYSNIGEPLLASEIVSQLPTETKKITRISKGGRTLLWEDRKNEFKYFYNVSSGQGLHMGLFRMMTHMVDLGFNADEIRSMIEDIIEESGNFPRPGYLEGSLYVQMNERLGIDKYGIHTDD